MKLNKELIKRLAAGEIQLKNTGSVEALNEILQAAFPADSSTTTGECLFFFGAAIYTHCWFTSDHHKSKLPIYTTEQFFETIPETMDEETRELAKQLFVHTGAGMDYSIKQAKEFVKLLNETE